MPFETKALFLLAVLVVVFLLWSHRTISSKIKRARSVEPDSNSSWSSEPISNSLFEQNLEHDIARPFFGKLDNSLFEQNKSHDLTRPFNYGYNERIRTNLFEMDKKDDLTRE